MITIKFNAISDSIKHFKSLQKRYMTTHNGKISESIEDALTALYEFYIIIKAISPNESELTLTYSLDDAGDLAVLCS